MGLKHLRLRFYSISIRGSGYSGKSQIVPLLKNISCFTYLKNARLCVLHSVVPLARHVPSLKLVGRLFESCVINTQTGCGFINWWWLKSSDQNVFCHKHWDETTWFHLTRQKMQSWQDVGCQNSITIGHRIIPHNAPQLRKQVFICSTYFKVSCTEALVLALSCKSLWIKAAAKWVNVNTQYVNVGHVKCLKKLSVLPYL